MNWNATQHEMRLIERIAIRAMKIVREHGLNYSQMDCVMDIEAAHCNGNRIDLAALLNAKDSDFGHDVFGIARHLNRETGQLGNCFSPRYTLSGDGNPVD